MSLSSQTSDEASSAAPPKSYSLFHSSSQTTSIKLDRTNYLVWESVVLPLIEGNRLQSHIDGKKAVPAMTMLSPETQQMVPNPEFDDWYTVDRMLVGWLRNTMTQDVGAQLLHCQTALDLWNGARALTSAASKSRVMVYRSDLHNTRKNNLSMTDYLMKMKTTADHLALAGAPISVDELILHTLNGLDADYNAIVVKLIDQVDLSWIDAQSALLAFESRLEQLNHFSSLTLQPSANFAARGSNRFGRNSEFIPKSTDPERPIRGTWRGRRSGRGRRS